MKSFESSISDTSIWTTSLALETAEEHREHLFQHLQQHGMAISTTKCNFGASEVSFLGHLISGKELTSLPQNVEAIPYSTKFP